MLNTILENFHVEKIFTALRKKLQYMIIAGVLAALLCAAFGNRFSYTTYRAGVSFYQ